MVLFHRILLLAIPFAFLSVSCRRGGDSLDRLLGDRGKSGSGDQALTLLKENEGIGAQGEGAFAARSTNGAGKASVLMDEGEPTTATPSTGAPRAKAPLAPVRYVSDADIRKWISLHQYDKVIAAKIDPKNASQLYYSGNAYFVTALMTKSASRERHVANAEKNFLAAGKLETDKTRKARAYLWLGITRYKFRGGTYDLETTSQPLRYVVEKLPDTPYYNDALLYLGLVRSKFNLRDSAKDYFNLLARTDSRDRVYDMDYQKWSTPQAAARHYLNLIGEPNKDGAEDLRAAPDPKPAADAGPAAAPAPSERPSPVYRPQGADSTRDAFLEKVERIHREILGTPMEGRSNAAPGSGNAIPAASATNAVTARTPRDAADAETVTPH